MLFVCSAEKNWRTIRRYRITAVRVIELREGDRLACRNGRDWWALQCWRLALVCRAETNAEAWRAFRFWLDDY